MEIMTSWRSNYKRSSFKILNRKCYLIFFFTGHHVKTGIVVMLINPKSSLNKAFIIIIFIIIIIEK